MKFVLPALTLLALSLTACADRAGTDAPDSAATSPSSSLPTDQPDELVPPATAPPAADGTDDPKAPAEVAAAAARFDGYGDLRFGMSAQQVEQTWDGELNGEPMPGSNCYYLNPVDTPSIAWFALMIDDGHFVRYDVGNDQYVAPGGGQRGMSIEQIEQLYAGRVQRQNHKYVEGGKYLRVAGDGGDGVLVFETGADGVVTDWHVGVPPQVDYVEGCA